MRFSELFNRTLREVSTETNWQHLPLALRAGLIYQYDSGRYSWLALGVIIRHKLKSLLAAHLQFQHRIETPSASPLAIAQISGHIINSYKQLPETLYQFAINTGEGSPKDGLLQLREYETFNTYTVYPNAEDSVQFQDSFCGALNQFFSRLGIDILEINGLDDGFSLVHPHPQGPDEYVFCPVCAYNGMRAVAKFDIPTAELDVAKSAMEKVETPDCKTIQAVADFVGVPTAQTLKAVFFVHEYPVDGKSEFVFAVIRGDLEISEAKLLRVLGGVGSLRPATDDEIRKAGAEPGYASPVRLDPAKVKIVGDISASAEAGFVVGANDAGYHFVHAVPERDFKVTLTADIAEVEDGNICGDCHVGQLKMERGIELGYSAQLGTRYSELSDAYFLDDQGKRQPFHLGMFKIGIERVLATAIELNHDENGIIWSPLVSPHHVHIVVLSKKQEPLETALAIGEQLENLGLGVLIDDRKESPGVKFTDADLLGLPLRIVVSDRSLKEGGAEVGIRTQREREVIPLNEVINWINMKFDELW